MKDFDDFSITIGDNIRQLRKIRGLTMRELADRIVECGGELVTENVISMWELGKRRIFAVQLYYIAKALECSPGLLFPDPDPGLAELFAGIPEDEVDVFKFAMSEWDGNARALVQFMAMYMALPRELRVNIAQTGVYMYELGKQSGKIDENAAAFDMDYIQEQINVLQKTLRKEAELRKIIEKDT